MGVEINYLEIEMEKREGIGKLETGRRAGGSSPPPAEEGAQGGGGPLIKGVGSGGRGADSSMLALDCTAPEGFTTRPRAATGLLLSRFNSIASLQPILPFPHIRHIDRAMHLCGRKILLTILFLNVMLLSCIYAIPRARPRDVSTLMFITREK